jgi:hypothetical protein
MICSKPSLLWTSIVLSASLLTDIAKAQPSFGNVNNPGVARWMAEEASWGTLTTTESQFEDGPSETKKVSHQQHAPSSSSDEEYEELAKDEAKEEAMRLYADITPFAASPADGRLFFFLMGELHLHGSALTLSQAAMTPDLFPVAGCGSMTSAVDAQDPRCAKITYQGSIHPCTATAEVGDDCDAVGREALFAKFPEMANFPEGHHFEVHEMKISSIWMIANFGGGNDVTPDEYHSAEVEVHIIEGGSQIDSIAVDDKEVPAWEDYVARSRWVVHHSLFSTISTLSDTADADAFGNIRSITDGDSLSSSTGRPIFYLPDVDPSAVDMSESEDQIILTFSEAALAQRVTDDGKTCAGQMAGMPTCAQVALYGKAVKNDNENALEYFGNYHPLAPWLAQGGSHMSGDYYTIEIEKIMLLDYFGGPKDVDVKEYLEYEFAPAPKANSIYKDSIHSSSSGMGSGMGGHDHGEHGGDGHGEHGGEGHGEHGGEGHGEHSHGEHGGEGHGEHSHGEHGGEGHGEHSHGEHGGEGHGGEGHGHEHQHGQEHESEDEGYSSSTQNASTTTTDSHIGVGSYIFIALSAFAGSLLGGLALEKISKRRSKNSRYLYGPAGKEDIDNSLELEIENAEKC